MQCQLRHPSSPERVHTFVLPDIGAVAAMLTQLERVHMWSAAMLEGKDHFVPRTVERDLSP